MTRADDACFLEAILIPVLWKDIVRFLAEAVVCEIIASGILPEGALQLICGSAMRMPCQ